MQLLQKRLSSHLSEAENVRNITCVWSIFQESKSILGSI